jgi:hypothetical protein
MSLESSCSLESFYELARFVRTHSVSLELCYNMRMTKKNDNSVRSKLLMSQGGVCAVCRVPRPQRLVHDTAGVPIAMTCPRCAVLIVNSDQLSAALECVQNPPWYVAQHLPDVKAYQMSVPHISAYAGTLPQIISASTNLKTLLDRAHIIVIGMPDRGDVCRRLTTARNEGHEVENIHAYQKTLTITLRAVLSQRSISGAIIGAKAIHLKTYVRECRAAGVICSVV